MALTPKGRGLLIVLERLRAGDLQQQRVQDVREKNQQQELDAQLRQMLPRLSDSQLRSLIHAAKRELNGRAAPKKAPHRPTTSQVRYSEVAGLHAALMAEGLTAAQAEEWITIMGPGRSARTVQRDLQRFRQKAKTK